MMRFILVNDRTPRADAYCALCCAKLDAGYIRENKTKRCYCDCICVAGHPRMARLALGYPARAVSLKCDHCRSSLGPISRFYWRMRFCSRTCEAAYLLRLDHATQRKISEKVHAAHN
jgi:hypothetical protein